MRTTSAPQAFTFTPNAPETAPRAHKPYSTHKLTEAGKRETLERKAIRAAKRAHL